MGWEADKIFLASASFGIRALFLNRQRHHDFTMAKRWGCLVDHLFCHSAHASTIRFLSYFVQTVPTTAISMKFLFLWNAMQVK